MAVRIRARGFRMGAAAVLALALVSCVGPRASAPDGATGTGASPTASGRTPSAPASDAPHSAPITGTSAETPGAPGSAGPGSKATAGGQGPGAGSAPPGASPSSAAPATPGAAAGPAELPERVSPLTVFYIALDDAGSSGPEVGCGDSVVAVKTPPERFRDQVQPTFERLLADHRATVGQSGLYNALYQSELVYASGSFDGTTITVWLEGAFSVGGVCDIPRIRAQLEYTAIAASGAARAEVLVNGRPLEEELSLR
ncbi:hypothetical protein [Sinomonas halotolerans]|uniref:GerMN domain-containing protein n=1 Tax=Sinomonas halotolerans TaxID=1644133 RepID=A0ABU9X069_9MICC